MYRELLQGFLQLLFPPRCPSCNRYTKVNKQWCPTCFEKLIRLDTLPYNQEVRSTISPIIAIAKYEEGMQKLIHSLKYHQQQGVTDYFSPFFNLLDLEYDFHHYDYIIPVPLHPQKLKERGFNQVDLIFKNWCERNSYTYAALLQRTRYTEKQYLLDYQARQENLHSAFSLVENISLTNSKCLLVDDIFTTGSTLKHCAQVLLEAGATSVSGLVLASNAN